MVIVRRVLLTLTMIGASAVASAPSVGATTERSVPWSSLGTVRPVLVQPAGWGSPVAAQPRSSNFGWCSQRGVELASASGTPTLVSDKSVGPMLNTAHLLPPGLRSGSGLVASCDDMALDPSHPKTVYAGFDASPNGSIPPVFNVVLVTSNLGRSWRFVPPPRGSSRTDFAGFIERPNGVELLYDSNYFFPMKPGQTASFMTASSSTGGRSWTDARLSCPSGTTCVIFGPQSPKGACGMSSWQQSVLVAAKNVGALPRWRPAGAVATVNQCGGQQLIATTSGAEYLIDRGNPHALHYTRDGIHWTAVSLPTIDGQPVGSRYTYLSQAMTIAANGDLVTISGSPSVSAGHLEILAPGSNSWCAANAALPAATKTIPVSAMLSSASRLVVTFSSPIRTARGNEISALTYPLSALRCRP